MSKSLKNIVDSTLKEFFNIKENTGDWKELVAQVVKEELTYIIKEGNSTSLPQEDSGVGGMAAMTLPLGSPSPIRRNGPRLMKEQGKSSKRNWYTGHKNGKVEAFMSDVEPTKETHGDKYNATTGPMTEKAARIMAKYGTNNPHMLSTADAERISKSKTFSDKSPVPNLKKLRESVSLMKEGSTGTMNKSKFEQMIADNNEEHGTLFTLSGAYGQCELWAKTQHGNNRLESGSLKDCYNMFVKCRFNEKYRVNNSSDINEAFEETDQYSVDNPESDNLPVDKTKGWILYCSGGYYKVGDKEKTPDPQNATKMTKTFALGLAGKMGLNKSDVRYYDNAEPSPGMGMVSFGDINESVDSDEDQYEQNQETSEPVDSNDKIALIKKIVDDKQYQTIKINGKKIVLDLYTASAALQIYNGLNPELKKKYVACDWPKFIKVTHAMMKKSMGK